MTARKRARRFAIVAGCAAALGLAPALFNIAVDPFEMAPIIDLPADKFGVAEPSHYPLWKVIHQPRQGSELYILGDSRARALREKLWRQAGVERVYNYAYGGGTIQEIRSTFELIKNDPSLRKLVIGAPLRCFDLNHRGGLNRVPEAVAMANDPIAYYSSWFVTKVSWRVFADAYPATVKTVEALIPKFSTAAEAAEVEAPESGLKTEIPPTGCVGCVAPAATQLAIVNRGVNLGLGRGAGAVSLELGLAAERFRDLLPISVAARELPKKIARQVERNARGDWAKFAFSEELFGLVAEISDWARKNDVQLVFVVPPTIVEMQTQIAAHGRTEQHRRFLRRLAELGTVVDLDFDSVMTRRVENFTDAYHFKGEVAREIVEEVVRLTKADTDADAPKPAAAGNARQVICPIRNEDVLQREQDGQIEMREGTGCRIWRTVDAQ